MAGMTAVSSLSDANTQSLIEDLTSLRDCFKDDMEARFKRLCNIMIADVRETRLLDSEALAQVLVEQVRAHFKGTATIDMVLITSINDGDDEDSEEEDYPDRTIRVLVVFTSDNNRLDPELTSSLVRRVRPFLPGRYHCYFPVFSFRSSHEHKDIEDNGNA